MSIPLISVVMSVYNASATLAEAVDSILAQTEPNFEFIIIDDGSTDESPQMLTAYAAQDHRIQVMTQTNQGLTIALNRGLAVAQGIFIARMDADDISLPQRFEKQVQYMMEHPETGICGTQVEIFGKREMISAVPTDPQVARLMLLFRTCVYHPTVMLRRAVLSEYKLAYDPSFVTAQDYDLWVQASAYTQICNTPEILLRYRVSSEQISQRKAHQQTASAWRIYRRLLYPLHINPTDDELALHQTLGWRDTLPSADFLVKADIWLQKLIAANTAYNVYEQPAFTAYLADLWYMTCRAAGGGFSTWRRFMQSPLRQHVSPIKWLRLLVHVLR